MQVSRAVFYSVKKNLYQKKPVQESTTHTQETGASFCNKFLVPDSGACV